MGFDVDLMKISRRVAFILVASVVLQLQAYAQAGLVINEIYIGTNAAINDQFIELYNPQTTTQYLDGCKLVQFGATGGDLSGASLTGVQTIWSFPGQAGDKTLAVAPGAFIVIAASATNHSGGLDLSFAGYEAVATPGPHNPKAVQLTHSSAALTYPGLTPSPIADAIVLTNGTGVSGSSIPLSSIIDGVQYDTAWVAGHLPASIDAGHTGGPNLKYGVSMERNKAGVTTLNSSYDFALFLPSPGVEHGTSKPVVAADLLPFDLRRFVDFNQYDTVTSGQKPNTYRSSQTVFATGLQFQGSNNVAWIRDTSYKTTSSAGQVSDLHFRATSAGDIQVFGDQAMLNYVLPANLASVFTPPNQWLDYFKTSLAVNTSYPVTTLTGTYSGATVTITFTGAYRGSEHVTVPRASFDSAYRFDLTANVQVSLGPLPLGSFSTTQMIWLSKGIGIIKMNMAHAGTTIGGQPVNVDGSERELIAYGIAAPARVYHPTDSIAVRAYPNPATDEITLSVPKEVRRVMLFATNGHLVRSFDVTGHGLEVLLWVKDLASAAYHARIEFADSSSGEVNMIVEH